MTTAIFKFKSDSVSGNQFTVVGFNGHEAISTLYRYEIELKAPTSAGIDLDDVLEARATFSIEQNGIESPVHGVLASFEEIRFAQNYCYYTAILVPEIWKLSNYQTNEIYYQTGSGVLGDSGQTIVDIIHQVFEHAGIASSDYDISSLHGKLLKREYVCQFNESDFDFVSRLLENEGVFYYFEQDGSAEKIIFINDLNYLTIPRPKLIFDVTAQVKNQDDCVYGLRCRKQQLPAKVIVRDYNTDEPSLDVSEVTPIDTMGQGTEYIYGKNVHSDTEAAYLSHIRAEEFICRKTQYFGESSVPRLTAGYIFVIEGHPNTIYNSVEYLALEVSHEGESLDMSLSSGQTENKPQYRNSFVAIPAENQFRPERKTIKPKITGTLHARIDGELDSEYAQLDDEGRYKVSLPFDFHNENHPEGLASARVRMMQPYAGKERGMQFPMAKGTEVLLSFVDGDPDRPIIAGAINTHAAPGPVTADNQTESIIQTGGNNKIRLEDKFGSERIMVESPAANSWIRVGSTNDPITLQGNSPQIVAIGSTAYTDPQATSTDSTDPLNPVASSPFSATDILDLYGNPTTMDLAVAGEYILKYVDSNNTSDTAYRRVIVCDESGAAGNDISGSTSDGIRIRSAGNLWNEARGRFGDYHIAPTATEAISLPRGNTNEIGTLYDKFAGSSPSYAPTGMKSYAGSTQTSFKDHVLPDAHLRVSSLDTITTQEGNIYDFGGYWNYNLGNSYAEDHVNQKANLNQLQDHDLLNLGGPGWTEVTWPSNSDTDRDVGQAAQTGAIAGASAGFVAGGVAGAAVGAAAGAGIGAALTAIGNLVDTSLSSSDVQLEGAHWEALTDPSSNVTTNSGEVWVQKKVGHDYEYHKGDAISVTVGSSLDIQHGGRHVELGFRGDTNSTLSSWSHSESGVSREKKWTSAGTLIYESRTESTSTFINESEKKYDRNTGALYSHTRSQGTGMGLAEFEFDYSNKVGLSFSFGSLISSETFGGAKITNENYLGLKIANENTLGASMSFEFAPLILKVDNDGAETNIPGLALKLGITDIKTKATEIEAKTAKIDNLMALIGNGTVFVKNGVITVQN